MANLNENRRLMEAQIKSLRNINEAVQVGLTSSNVSKLMNQLQKIVGVEFVAKKYQQGRVEKGHELRMKGGFYQINVTERGLENSWNVYINQADGGTGQPKADSHIFDEMESEEDAMKGVLKLAKMKRIADILKMTSKDTGK